MTCALALIDELGRVDAALLEAVDLLEQHLEVDHDAVADDRDAAGAQDAAGQQVQGVLLVADDDRVAGVVAAVELHDVVDPATQEVGGLALALVAPLGSDDDDCGHGMHHPHTCDKPRSRGALTEALYFSTPYSGDLMNRLLAIANAEAGTADDQSVEAALDVLRADADVTLVRTASPGDLDQALAEHPDVDGVVAMGGDGSVHAVVAAMHAADRLTGAFVAVIPLGTGNDFAHTIGLPDDPADAARLVSDGAVREFDLIIDRQDRVVVNAAHIGVGAEAAAAAVPWKKRFGPVGYVIGSLVAGLRALVKPGARVEITVDGKRLPGHRVVQVAVGNGRFVGGGTLLLPGADPADGLLDVAVSYPLRRSGASATRSACAVASTCVAPTSDTCAPPR